ncbi:MAG: DUF4097 family beta strand repeat protein [Candidatus Aegiribacteria sp.]|nr:DUF4097 family beta strand repeat protein [Candidatus Aegiribacteria sp.]
MNKSLLFYTIALLAANLPVFGQDGSFERDTLSIIPEPGMSVSVSNVIGNINVFESVSNEISLIYAIEGFNSNSLESLDVSCEAGDFISCVVSNPGYWSGAGEAVVNFTLLIPSGSELDIVLQTTEGDVTMETGGGSALVEILKGNATISDVTGDLTVNVVSGDVELNGCSGLKLVNVVDGNLSGNLETLVNDVAISSITGHIKLTIPDDMEVEVSTVEGTITIPGVDARRDFIGSSARFGEGNRTIEISSYSGDITLSL